MRASHSLGTALLTLALASPGAAPAESLTVPCDGSMTMVPGVGDRVHVTGTCAMVVVSGDGNEVFVDRADSINLSGTGNTLVTGDVRRMLLAGEDNVATIGNTDEIWAAGSGNAVNAERATRISAPGDGGRIELGVDSDRSMDWIPGRDVVVTLRDPGAASAASPLPSPADPNGSKASAPAAAAQGVTVPAGDGLADLREVVYRVDEHRNGGSLNLSHHVYALYADGTALFDPAVPLHLLDKAASRRATPDAWGRWRGEVRNLEVDFGKGWNRAGREIGAVAPAATGTALAGRYQWYWVTGGMMGGGSVSSASYTFSEGNRYAISSSSMMGTGPDLGAGTTTINTVCSAGGRVAGTSSSGPGGTLTTSETGGGGCGSAVTGTYRIDGYSITLQADDGRTVSLPFYRRSANEIIVGGRGYLNF